MAFTLIGPGPRSWSLETDDAGDRTYKIKFRVATNDPRDGPYLALQTTGLPLPGSPWAFGNDFDPDAYCRRTSTVRPYGVTEGRPVYQYDVEKTFSTKSEDESSNPSCENGSIKDPLLMPDRLSGDFKNYLEELTRDRFGNPIVSSSWEQLRGAQVEFDRNRPSVVVEQNVAVLGLSVFAPMVDCLNSVPMWGLPRRCVKLSNVTWERKYYGTCYRYFTRRLMFDVRRNGFDRDLLDEGSKVLRGDWDRVEGSGTFGKYVVADDLDAATAHLNPNNFIRFKDFHGENARAILDGRGRPYDPDATADPKHWVIWPEPTDEEDPFVVGPLSYADAALAATAAGGFLFGPFDSSADADEAIASGDYGSVVSTDPSATPGSIHVEGYGEANFFLLGVPIFLE